jgi:tRNA pseudouridine55 synthase
MAVLVIDKPVGLSSFDVVRRVKRELGRLWGAAAMRGLKLGHGGTLDPLASGVLPICLGEGTKLAPFLLAADKEYLAGIRFGSETDTLDATGTVTRQTDVASAGLDADRLRASVAERFSGTISQVPPMHSALKHEGRPLYRYARAGVEIEREARVVTIHAFELLSWEPPATASFRIHCTKGTYVRVLAADLGQALGVGGHLISLRRTCSGPFRLAQAITLEALTSLVDAREPLPLIPLAAALGHLPGLTVSAEVALAVTQGKQLTHQSLGAPSDLSGRIRVLRQDGTLLAIADLSENGVASRRVFGTWAPPVANTPPGMVTFSEASG